MLRELIKEILKEELLGKSVIREKETEVSVDSMIGKIVMVRTYSAGVHFGTLFSKEGKEVVLKNAHRVYSWTNACTLSQLAIEGSGKSNIDNKISMAVPEILLTEAIEVIPMLSETFKALTSFIWKK